MPEANFDVISQNLNERNIIIYPQHGDDISKVREHDALLQSPIVQCYQRITEYKNQPARDPTRNMRSKHNMY